MRESTLGCLFLYFKGFILPYWKWGLYIANSNGLRLEPVINVVFLATGRHIVTSRAVRKPFFLQMAALHRDFYMVQFIISMGDRSSSPWSLYDTHCSRRKEIFPIPFIHWPVGSLVIEQVVKILFFLVVNENVKNKN